jgi:Type IV secretion-system coupling protein DNA-binding domain
MSMTGEEENVLLKRALNQGVRTVSGQTNPELARKVATDLAVQAEKVRSENRVNEIANGKGKLTIGYGDFSRHIYLIGAWGTGKTSLVRLVAKALEQANKTINPKTGKYMFPNAFIYIDPKGDDSDKFLKQFETLDADILTYLDPDETGFAICPLELPPHSPQDHERIVTIYIEFLLNLIEEWYSSTPATAPRMINIFEILLTYLYRKTNSPTFIDLYDLTLKVKAKDKFVMQDIERTLKEDEARELSEALKEISEMEDEAFRPVLTRLSKFAIQPYLRRLFSARHSTVDSMKLIEPGHFTIIRVAASSIGKGLSALIRSVVLLNIWFAVQQRASLVKEENRTDVILALDEFQDVQHLQALQTILAQARSFKLDLILAHQSSAQLAPELFQMLMGCAVQGAGRVIGDDATKLAKSWDPQFSTQIVQTLTTQPDFTWTFRLRASEGQEQPPPIQRRILPPPHYLHSEAEVTAFKQTMKQMYGDVQVAKSLFVTREDERWQDYLPEWIKELPSQREWRVLIALKENQSMSFYKLSELLGLRRGEGYDKFYFEMRDKGLIEIEAKANSHYCSLGVLGKKLVDPDLLNDEQIRVVKGEDGIKIAQEVLKHYQSKLCFIFPAVQRKDKGMIEAPDFLVYDYATQTAFAIEIESRKEGGTHGEQVTQNLNKYFEKFAALGLKRLEVWCHADMKEHVLYLVSEFLRDKEQFKDRIFIVCPEELPPHTVQPEPKKPEGQAPTQ